MMGEDNDFDESPLTGASEEGKIPWEMVIIRQVERTALSMSAHSEFFQNCVETFDALLSYIEPTGQIKAELEKLEREFEESRKNMMRLCMTMKNRSSACLSRRPQALTCSQRRALGTVSKSDNHFNASFLFYIFFYTIHYMYFIFMLHFHRST